MVMKRLVFFALLVSNFFVEPQWTAVHAGVAPEWQIFSGLNMQFPLTR
jgi:hypothetical protein